MENLRIKRVVDNMEIICKLMNSVAKQYGCRVKYNSQSRTPQFSGDPDCIAGIVEEVASFFRTGWASTARRN